ncbi:hypothetical protein [Streptomyces gobiensis]|uniref:hypothetical protein n=1 Tax=Streptomyces gobiensis TaxID=2875706 RepID=UPI001E650834|nr:hypothetical protein [Streptomyces gobiensis]UGY92836.1 hypothetical protein test1122_14745 [Streptomyces gobiensis]
MKIAGFYQEFWEDKVGTSAGSIKDFLQADPIPDEEDVRRYLDEGYELWSIMGAVGDVLGSEKRLLGGDSIFTDGEWVWRGDLWFYLTRYHVQLPEDFLSRIRGFSYSMPPVEKGRLDSLASEVAELL